MSDKVQTNFADILKTEGVNAKGYGLIPKIPMQDLELSLTAKSIYAFFCSLAGNGDTTFPGRDYITEKLDLNKETYYKHVKQLTEHGYITVEKQNSTNGQFAHNVYTLVSNPKKLAVEQQQEGEGTLYGTLGYTGIMSQGYGMIPRMVMFDERLSAKAKGLYAYFASYSGAGKVAFPRASRIQYHLQVSPNTYQKLLKELTTLNYLSVVQRHVNGKLSVNDYYLMDKPDEAEVRNQTMQKSVSFTEICEKQKAAQVPKIPYMVVQLPNNPDMDNQVPKKPDTVKTLDTQGFHELLKIPYMDKQDSVKQDWAKQDMVKQDSGIPDTNNNSPFSSNSSLYYQSINQQVPAHWIDSMDRNTLRNYIRELLDYEGFELSGIPKSINEVNGLIELVLDVLRTKTATIRVNGGEVERLDVIERLLSLTYEHYEYVLECVKSNSGHVRNIKAYYLTALYNAPTTMDAWYEQRVNEDWNGKI